MTTSHRVQSGPAGENWARNYRYAARAVLRPESVEQVQELVAGADRIRALGTRHSFSALPDTRGDLVDLGSIDPDLTIDEAAGTATVGAGIRYGDLATALHAGGWALHNLASLPHISVAGATATGTHGSGDRNGSLATAVVALETVSADGELTTARRGDPDFEGRVVSLGALGVVTRVTLEIEPSFDVRQDLYDELPWDALLENVDAVTGSAYSVSLFTDWLGDTLPTVWLKSRADAAEPPPTLFGAARRSVDPGVDQSTLSTTEQGGVFGPWSDRLAHFKLGFTPSNGDELQSEYLIARENLVEALGILRGLGRRIAPLLRITEIRTMAADTLWLSGAHGRDTVGIHFTWKPLAEQIRPLLAVIEAELLPLGARPHWGKVFTAGSAEIAPLYPRMRDFRDLAARVDPGRKFGNEFLERTVFGETS